ncbi:type II toxin-antitoxin system HicA family toxin [Saccharothrix australiensis]|nr:type II toxin-antitoxin system HicA family toxin [Saccharothrix australiensis]
MAALRLAGFDHVSTKGSHAKLRNEGGRTVVVPLHDELAKGTLSSILKQASLTTADLLALLRS